MATMMQMQTMQMILVLVERREGERRGRASICGVISNPYELYSFTPAFEQAINDGDNDADADDADDTGVGGEEGGHLRGD